MSQWSIQTAHKMERCQQMFWPLENKLQKIFKRFYFYYAQQCKDLEKKLKWKQKQKEEKTGSYTTTKITFGKYHNQLGQDIAVFR